MLATLPYAWTQDPAADAAKLLNAPNDLVLPGSDDSGDVNYLWIHCLGSDIDKNAPAYDTRELSTPNSGIYFAKNDNLFIEAIRLESPFGDGLVNTQPQIFVRLMFSDVRTDLPPGMGGGLSANQGPSLYIDLHQPFGEWQEVGQYLPITTAPLCADPAFLTGLRPQLLAKTFTRTWKTVGVDPAYNGLPSKVEINVRVRHQLPRNSTGAL